MRTPRRTAAGVALTFVLMLAVLAACSGQTAKPGAAPSPSVRHSATVVASPTATRGSRTASPAPSARVASFRLAYPWHWPNDVAAPGRVTHASHVPPVPELVRISVGDHPGDPGERPFNRMSFTFTTAFPGYRFEFTNKLISDPGGRVIPLSGLGVLKIVFTQAQAHTAGGARSTIISQPARNIGYQRMADFSQGGDFEGVLTYGIGITWPNPQSNPQLAVRAYEVGSVTASGQHRYVVAIDIDASNPA